MINKNNTALKQQKYTNKLNICKNHLYRCYKKKKK